MNLYLQQDSDVLASITGAARLPCDSIVLRMGRPDIVLGCVLVDNPMHENWMVDPDLPGDRLFCYSGTLADGEDPFIGDMRNWTPGGLEALQELIERIQPALETQDRSICLRPHAQGILSDVPGCRKFMETAPPRVELCVDPIGMLTAEMLPDAEFVLNVDDYPKALHRVPAEDGGVASVPHPLSSADALTGAFALDSTKPSQASKYLVDGEVLPDWAAVQAKLAGAPTTPRKSYLDHEVYKRMMNRW